MAYASEQDLIYRFGESEVIQITRGTTTVNSSVLAEAQAQADAEIDGYLRGRYALPLAGTPEIINRCACDIARWILYSGVITEEVERRYKRSIELLEKIAKGDIQLGLLAAPSESEVNLSSDMPQFESDELQDWRSY